MFGYLKIYVKKDNIGHIRYEISGDYGFKMIRGLSVSKLFRDKQTIYEKGEEDSHGISIYNKKEYIPSKEIPLNRQELISAVAYTKTNDENPPEYYLADNNCRDLMAGLLAASGKEGCVGDYLTNEQKSDLRLSRLSDLDKCEIPRIVEKGMDKAQQAACKGIIQVGSYLRQGNLVEAYTRNCGRH